MLFSLTRRLLFLLPPEVAHDFSMATLDGAQKLGLMRLAANPVKAPVQLLGLTFQNRVGLAAGLDKNADHIGGLAQLGFGFLEVGTVTPKPQPGNDRPRLFRIPERQALINRMGFNNKGVDHLVEQLATKPRPSIPIGINIGKNRNTSNQQAIGDYLHCLEAVYDAADYITVNLSSPNTPGLRELQEGQALQALVTGLMEKRSAMAERTGRRVPLVVKIAPDIDPTPLTELADTLLEAGIDGIIATNTTLDRQGVAGCKHAEEVGGLSGQPLTEKSTDIVRKLRAHIGDDCVLIAAGGIASAQDALYKVNAGADLVQIYTGLIYRGPSVISESASALANMPCESDRSPSK